MTDTLTDWYAQVESGLSDRLRAELKVLGYVTKDYQVSDNDSDLHKGNDYFIIFRPGPFPMLPITYKTGEIMDVDWSTYAALYVKYQEKADQWAAFKPFRNAVIQMVMKHRFLKKATIDSVVFQEVPFTDRIRAIGGNDEPGYFRFFGVADAMPPNFMTQTLAISTRSRIRFE